MMFRCLSVLLIFYAFLVPSFDAQAKTVVMAGSAESNTVFSVEADSATLIGDLSASINGGVGDCAIHPNQSFGFVSNSSTNITVIDLDGVPLLASGVNPIVSPFQVHEVEVSGDGRWLAACGTGGPNGIGFSLFDLETRTRVVASTIGPGCQAVAFCGPDLYVATELSPGTALRRLAVDDQGGVTVSHQAFLNNDTVLNLACGARTDSVIGVMSSTPNPRLVVYASQPNSLLTFQDALTIPGGGTPRSAATFQQEEGQDPYLIVRYDTASTSADVLRAVRLDAATNDFANGGAVLWQRSAPVPSTYGTGGLDQLAVSPRSGRLYAATDVGLSYYDGVAGTPLGSIVPRDLGDVLGVCAAPREIFILGGFESGDLDDWSGAVSPASGPQD